MKTLRQKRRNYLNDTKNHYNLDNRSMIDLKCTYYPAHKDSEGCAIGRKIKDKELCKRLDKGVGPCNVQGINQKEIFDLLPTKTQELGQDFLGEIQSLHDVEVFWENSGLSNIGKKRVKEIRKLFKL